MSAIEDKIVVFILFLIFVIMTSFVWEMLKHETNAIKDHFSVSEKEIHINNYIEEDIILRSLMLSGDIYVIGSLPSILQNKTTFDAKASLDLVFPIYLEHHIGDLNSIITKKIKKESHTHKWNIGRRLNNDVQFYYYYCNICKTPPLYLITVNLTLKSTKYIFSQKMNKISNIILCTRVQNMIMYSNFLNCFINIPILTKDFYKKPFHITKTKNYNFIQGSWIESTKNNISSDFFSLKYNKYAYVPKLREMCLFMFFEKGYIQ